MVWKTKTILLSSATENVHMLNPWFCTLTVRNCVNEICLMALLNISGIWLYTLNYYTMLNHWVACTGNIVYGRSDACVPRFILLLSLFVYGQRFTLSTVLVVIAIVDIVWNITIIHAFNSNERLLVDVVLVCLYSTDMYVPLTAIVCNILIANAKAHIVDAR